MKRHQDLQEKHEVERPQVRNTEPLPEAAQLMACLTRTALLNSSQVLPIYIMYCPINNSIVL